MLPRIKVERNTLCKAINKLGNNLFAGQKHEMGEEPKIKFFVDFRLKASWKFRCTFQLKEIKTNAHCLNICEPS